MWSRALSRARVPWWRHRQAAEHLRKGPGRRRRQRQRPEEQSLRHFLLPALRSTAQQGEEQGSEDVWCWWIRLTAAMSSHQRCTPTLHTHTEREREGADEDSVHYSRIDWSAAPSAVSRVRTMLWLSAMASERVLGVRSQRGGLSIR